MSWKSQYYRTTDTFVVRRSGNVDLDISIDCKQSRPNNAFLRTVNRILPLHTCILARFQYSEHHLEMIVIGNDRSLSGMSRVVRWVKTRGALGPMILTKTTSFERSLSFRKYHRLDEILVRLPSLWPNENCGHQPNMSTLLLVHVTNWEHQFEKS